MEGVVGRLPRGRHDYLRLQSVRKGSCGRVTSVLDVARSRIGIGVFETQRAIGREFRRFSDCKLWMRRPAFKPLLRNQSFSQEEKSSPYVLRPKQITYQTRTVSNTLLLQSKQNWTENTK